MKGPWLSVLLTAILVFFGCCSGQAPKVPCKEPPQVVWRGERNRTPEDIEQAGGFLSRGYFRLQNKETLTPEQFNKGSSLYEHACGRTAEFTHYVSTTSEAQTAVQFAIDFQDPEKIGYVYRIRTDAKAIDMNASLGKYSPYGGQMEHAFIGHIPMDQIEGWFIVKAKNAMDLITSKGEATEGIPFIRNAKYIPEKYLTAKGSGAQPQLAGFPSNYPGWKAKPWKEFRDKKVSDSLGNFFWKDICPVGADCKLIEVPNVKINQ